MHNDAELYADGDIHVYGRMKGRVVAGLRSSVLPDSNPSTADLREAQGNGGSDPNAEALYGTTGRASAVEPDLPRIFTSCFSPTNLVGIGDCFFVLEDEIKLAATSEVSEAVHAGKATLGSRARLADLQALLGKPVHLHVRRARSHSSSHNPSSFDSTAGDPSNSGNESNASSTCCHEVSDAGKGNLATGVRPGKVTARPSSGDERVAPATSSLRLGLRTGLGSRLLQSLSSRLTGGGDMAAGSNNCDVLNTFTVDCKNGFEIVITPL